MPPKPTLLITGKGAGPILVVGTTGDPATPIEGTRQMAEDLEGGMLVTVEAYQHTGYRPQGCVAPTVDAYLIAKTLPKPGFTCH